MGILQMDGRFVALGLTPSEFNYCHSLGEARWEVARCWVNPEPAGQGGLNQFPKERAPLRSPLEILELSV